MDAAACSRSKLIYPFLYILCWTGLRSDEDRNLQWGQIDFEAGQITVGKSKNESGVGRQIPMTAALLSVLTQYRAWYESKLGSVQPDWYVFPLSNRIKPVDPTRPVTSLKQAWRVFARLQRLAAACMIGGIRSAQNLLKPESLKAPCLILWETHERQDVAAILPQSSQGPPRSYYCGNRSSGFTSGPPRSPQSERTGARRIRRNSLKGRVAQVDRASAF